MFTNMYNQRLEPKGSIIRLIMFIIPSGLKSIYVLSIDIIHVNITITLNNMS